MAADDVLNAFALFGVGKDRVQVQHDAYKDLRESPAKSILHSTS